jgi:hypothetical protein
MGASDWTAKKRQKFANDPLNLEAVDADENGEKSDENAVDYRPEEVDAECWFLARQVSIKTKYELQAAEEEKAVFVDRLSSDDCLGGYRDLETSKDYRFPKPKPIGEPKPKPKPEPEPRQTQEPKPDRNVYYKNCDAVRAAGAAPIHRADPGCARHLDRDGDGVGCES